jgi:RNA polymerase sigma-70 factor (ECF subfamily)
MNSGPAKEDWDALMQAALDGDSTAYARFLRAVTPVLRGIVLARGNAQFGAAGCEDILQEVLLAIHLKRHTWRRADPIRPWLYAIARHKVIDAFRARGRAITVPVEDFHEVLAAPADPDPLADRDRDRMLSLLDPRAADLLRGIGVAGDSIAETAGRLGMSEGAVRVALHRALKKLGSLRERHVE